MTLLQDEVSENYYSYIHPNYKGCAKIGGELLNEQRNLELKYKCLKLELCISKNMST